MIAEITVFDIETSPIDKETILAEAEPFDMDAVKVGNRQVPSEIAKYKEAQKTKWEEQLVNKAALNPLTGQVLCCGFYTVSEERFNIIEGTEEEVLLNFWTLLRYGVPYTGFNIYAFDLPFLMRRSWRLGIDIPAWVWDGRYFHKSLTDLMQCWQLGARNDYISLDRLSKFIGLNGKSTVTTGKDFHLLYATDHDAAIEYLKQDLRLTAQIAQRLL